ncbi:MAG TPA: PilZ domain-containing protein [Planctomycetota bacterium]|nr:PilZ domain-containing protein [Planctomycetota bacterium]
MNTSRDGGTPEWFQEFQNLNRSTTSARRPEDRRRFPRFEIDEASGTLQTAGLLGLLRWGRRNLARCAVDLAEGGARLLLHRRVAPGTKVRVRIEMERYKDAVEAAGVVRWCYQSARRKDDFHAGVMFVNLDPAQQKKVALMRDWFTSPQYKALRETRLRSKGPEIIFPK